MVYITSTYFVGTAVLNSVIVKVNQDDEYMRAQRIAERKQAVGTGGDLQWHNVTKHFVKTGEFIQSLRGGYIVRKTKL
jgi:hypothetical protein